MKDSDIQEILEKSGVQNPDKLSQALGEILRARLLTRDFLTEKLKTALNNQLYEYSGLMKDVVKREFTEFKEQRETSGAAHVATEENINNAIKKVLEDDTHALKNVMTSIESANANISKLEDKYLKDIVESLGQGTKKFIDNISTNVDNINSEVSSIKSQVNTRFVGTRDWLFWIISIVFGFLGGLLSKAL